MLYWSKLYDNAVVSVMPYASYSIVNKVKCISFLLFADFIITQPLCNNTIHRKKLARKRG